MASDPPPPSREISALIAEASPEKRAPEPLRIVQQFVNSADFEEGKEDLDTPSALGEWLRARDLLSPGKTVSAADHRRALDVREGLRAVLLAHNGSAPDATAVKRLEEAAGHASLRPSFPPGQPPVLIPACQGVSGALAQLLGIVAGSAAEGTWQRLKACADDGCQWAFYDHSKNRSGRWCSMSTCGNQQKARSYRERRREG